MLLHAARRGARGLSHVLRARSQRCSVRRHRARQVRVCRGRHLRGLRVRVGVRAARLHRCHPFGRRSAPRLVGPFFTRRGGALACACVRLAPPFVRQEQRTYAHLIRDRYDCMKGGAGPSTSREGGLVRAASPPHRHTTPSLPFAPPGVSVLSGPPPPIRICRELCFMSFGVGIGACVKWGHPWCFMMFPFWMGAWGSSCAVDSTHCTPHGRFFVAEAYLVVASRNCAARARQVRGRCVCDFVGRR